MRLTVVLPAFVAVDVELGCGGVEVMKGTRPSLAEARSHCEHVSDVASSTIYR